MEGKIEDERRRKCSLRVSYSRLIVINISFHLSLTFLIPLLLVCLTSSIPWSIQSSSITLFSILIILSLFTFTHPDSSFCFPSPSLLESYCLTNNLRNLELDRVQGNKNQHPMLKFLNNLHENYECIFWSQWNFLTQGSTEKNLETSSRIQ